MKRTTARPPRRNQAARQIMTPIPVWNGRAADVQLSDWAAFAQTNQLSVTRSFIAGECNGRLQVVVYVATSAI